MTQISQRPTKTGSDQSMCRLNHKGAKSTLRERGSGGFDDDLRVQEVQVQREGLTSAGSSFGCSSLVGGGDGAGSGMGEESS